ncbi:MAG: type 4a pilus biogenesis protein PilO, partial [bacterium]|nr:type 4a pilus biogenesis protein PilO [bacterium]
MKEVLRGTVTPKDWMAVAAILGLTALVVVVFKLFIGSAQDDRYQQLIRDDSQIVADLQVAEQKKANIETLRAKTAEIELLVDEFQKRLPDTREIPNLVRKFEDLA